MYTLANKELIEQKQRNQEIKNQTNHKIIQDFQNEVIMNIFKN